jgi:hypothetical protein
MDKLQQQHNTRPSGAEQWGCIGGASFAYVRSLARRDWVTLLSCLPCLRGRVLLSFFSSSSKHTKNLTQSGAGPSDDLCCASEDHCCLACMNMYHCTAAVCTIRPPPLPNCHH